MLKSSSQRVLATFLFAFCCSPTVTLADVLEGRVVSIADGDTITVLDSSNTQHKIRLAGIDAPEKKQPFGIISRQHLGDLVFSKQVRVEWSKLDRYGRIVGKVLVGNTNACLEQLKAGLAWHYTKYEKEQPPADRVSYKKAEEEARGARLGLWRENGPVPPWEWRRTVR